MVLVGWVPRSCLLPLGVPLQQDRSSFLPWDSTYSGDTSSSKRGGWNRKGEDREGRGEGMPLSTEGKGVEEMLIFFGT